MPYGWPTDWYLSMSTAATRTRPLSALAAFSHSGARFLQWPHLRTAKKDGRLYVLYEAKPQCRHLPWRVELDEPQRIAREDLLAEGIVRELDDSRIGGVQGVDPGRRQQACETCTHPRHVCYLAHKCVCVPRDSFELWFTKDFFAIPSHPTSDPLTDAAPRQNAAHPLGLGCNVTTNLQK